MLLNGGPVHCPCCGKGELRPIKEVGHISKDRCNICNAIVPRHGEAPNLCPLCHRTYYDVEDYGDVSFFVHSRYEGKAQGCTIPTTGLTDFESGVDRLRRGTA